MYIEKFINNGISYIRLTQSIRVKDKKGRKVVRKKVILNVGPLSRYEDGKPEYFERLKQSFKEGNPLIEELKKYSVKEKEQYKIIFNEGQKECLGESKRCVQILIEKIIESLGIDRLFATMKKSSRIKYDVYGFAKLLIFGRIMEPASKIETIRQNQEYYEAILDKNYNEDNVYDTLTFIGENKDKIVRRINTKLQEIYGNRKDYIYYDVTNFYFEREKEDEDEYELEEENGEQKEVIKEGLRKYGVSKENRRLPIVQMGLFMDNEGMPISIETFPGNRLDQKTLRPALSKNIDGIEKTRFILVADRGICNGENIKHIVEAGNGYIISKSLERSKKEERQWAYLQDGYIEVSKDFKYKSRIIKREIKDEQGNRTQIEEKVVVYWSRKFYEKAIRDNRNFLKFMEKMQDRDKNFKITSTQVNAIKRFMKQEYVNKNTGEIIDSKDIITEIDFNKLEEYKRGFGYYQIVTSEREMSEQEIIDKYHGLTRLEEQFRIMKGTLETRPMYVWTQEHINAHLMICLIALIIIRIIQRQIKEYMGKQKGNNKIWENVLSADRIQKALNKWQIDILPSDLHRFLNINDEDLSIILKAFNINIEPKLYRRGELKAIKSSIILKKAKM